jgi:hypothetical protein
MHTFRIVNGKRERTRPRVGPCRHFGAEVRRESCLPCEQATGRKTALKVFGCATHGECTPATALAGVRCCVNCHDYQSNLDPQPFRTTPVCDLAYHVYPVRGNDGWRWNVEQLLSRIGRFNGRRVVSVVVDEKTDDAEEVWRALRGEVDRADFLTMRNDPHRWESRTLPVMLERLQSTDPARCFLFAHAKSVTRPGNPISRRWADSLYRLYLDGWPAVEEQLGRHPVTGAFRLHRRQWPQQSAADWFYSGSWFWCRSHCLFGRDDWRCIDPFIFAVESYAPTHFPYEQSGCLACDDAGDCYNALNWQRRLGPEVEAVVARNSRPALPEAVRLATCVTENYVPRARPFLASLARVQSARLYCVCMGFDPGGLRAEFPYVDFRSMSRHPSESFGMLQTGRWLDVLPTEDGDPLYVLSDADAIVQRDFTSAELARFARYDGDTVGAGWNACEGDELAAEADRIRLAGRERYGDLSRPCFNCGVLAARASVWRRLRDEYESRCAEFYALTMHRSRSQFLLVWCMHRLGFRVDVLPVNLHANGHFGVPSGVEMRDGLAWAGGDPVLFRHALGN